MEIIKAGDKVICNGFPGVVLRILPYAPSMAEVRLNSGVVVSAIKWFKKA